MSKVLSLRVADDLAEWADSYAQSRGVTRQALLEEGLQSFREDCEAGVPEIRQAAKRQASYTGVSERGVGDCPERPDGFGHVWVGPKVDPEQNRCKFCGTAGRGKSPAMGGTGDSFFERATNDRVELFSRLATPASATGKKVER